MPSSLERKGKLGTWLSSKLSSLVHNKHKPASGVYRAPELIDAAGCAPLDANNPHRKRQMYKLPACHGAADDCSQNLPSSDQASAVARIEDQQLSSYPSEQYGSECSFTESVRAATLHMATLRSLLVNHISETHDASAATSKLAGPNLLSPLQQKQQQQDDMVSSEHPAGHDAAASHSTALPCGSPSSTDRKVQALLADQMQLLDLVQTLIADHRNSLLEQRRLQQQLAATQQALHVVRLDKDRAAALADVRSEEISQAQADLAHASATVQQLHAVRTISSRRIALPPANTAAAVPAADALVSPCSAASSAHGAGPSPSSAQLLTPSKGASAIIGRIAPENSWQDLHAIVGPAPASQPLAAGAAAAPMAGGGGSSKTAAGVSSSSSKQAGASSNKQAASNKPGLNSRLPGSKRPAISSSKGSRKTASETSAALSAAESQRSTRQRRLLLGEAASGSKPAGSAAATQAGAGAARAAAAASAQGASAAAGTAARTKQGAQPRSAGARRSQESLGDASVHVQLVQQQHPDQVDSAAGSAGSAARPAAAAAAAKDAAAGPSAASKLAHVHASALEGLLLQRLRSGAGSKEQLQQQLLSASIETDGSAVSGVAWADADAAAAAVGLTKQQLHQLLQRPWLPRASQQEGLEPEAAAAAAATGQGPMQGVEAAAAVRKQQEQLLRREGAHADDESDSGDTCSGSDQSSSESSGKGSDQSRGESSEAEDDDGDGSSCCSDASSSQDGSIVAEPQGCPAAAAATTGNRAAAAAGAVQQQPSHQQRQSQQQHGQAGVAARSSVASRLGAGVCSSNGSSWPGMKSSLLAMNSGMLTALQPAATRPSPSYHKLSGARTRSRTQPLQLSTSLESAETLSLTTAQHAVGSGSQSSSLTTAATCPYGCVDAAACACCCAAAAAELEARGVGGGAAAAAAGRGRSKASSSRSGQRRSGADSSCDMAQQGSMENLGSAMCRRKLGLPAAAAGAAAGTQRQQRQRVAQQINTQQQQQVQKSAQPANSRKAAAAGSAAAHAAAAAGEQSPVVQAAADPSGADSDGECGSVVSAATGCTDLSSLAGIDLQARSQARPRPAIVPKLSLPVHGTQQQGRTGRQAAGAGGAAGGSNSSQQQQQQGGSRALLMAQQSDMAPLIAQPGSSRNRRGTPRALTPGAAAGGAAGTAAVAAAAGPKVEKAGGSFTLQGTARAQSFTSGQASRPSTAAAAAAGVSSTAASSPADSARSRRCAAGGAVVAAAPGSAGGGSAGQYWGSTAGSCPASEEPSRQPTPTAELPCIYVPAAAAGLPLCGAACTAAEPGAASGVGSSEVAAAGGYDTASIAAGSIAGDVASSAGGAGGDGRFLAHIATGPVLVVQQGPAVLTPRSTVTPRGLAPSSAAAAGSTYMTMRPAHMYKSVSTVYAMYSPLRGGLRALGHNKPGSGTAGAGAELQSLSAAAAGGVAGGDLAGLLGQQHAALPGLAGTGLVAGAAGALGVAGAARDVSGGGSEYHWQALLGGCPTVPEEEGVPWGDAAAAAAGGPEQMLEQQFHVPGASGSPEYHLGPVGAEGSAAAVLDGEASVDEGRGSLAIGVSSDAVYYYFEHGAAGAGHPAALPTLEDFQQMVRQELEQQQQQQQQEELERDVVERGPLFRPGSASPTAGSRQLRSSTGHQGASSMRSSTAAAAAAGSSASPPAVADVAAGGTVGPLTASSPTRRRNSGAAVVVAAPQQQQQMRNSSNSSSSRRHQQHSSRQHRESREQQHSRPAPNVSAAAAARVERAAAAVAARVAAVAARTSRQQQQHDHYEELEQQQQQQQQGQQDVHLSPAADGSTADASAVSSSHAAERRSRPRQQQQLESSSRSHSHSTTPHRTPSSQHKRQQQRGQQQRPEDEEGGVRSSRHSSGRTPGGGSDRHSSRGHSASRQHASAASSTAGQSEPEHLVTSYHNPMVALEAAGLGAADEEALVNAGLVPGFGAAAARTPSPGGAGRLPGCGSASDVGVGAAAVPAHVTPLAKERSAGGGSQQGSVSGEQSAGGQLHWNPLYDPNALAGSPVMSYG